MKKILTIVALALILCLGISAVLADNQSSSDEFYRAKYVGEGASTVVYKNGYPVLTYDQVKEASNWLVTEGDYQPLPDSAAIASSDTAKKTYPVDRVHVGTMNHAEPTLVTLYNDETGIAAHAMVWIKGNDHVTETEWKVEDDWCYSREVCTVPGCEDATSWKKAPPHKSSTIEMIDGTLYVVCTECHQIISTYDGHPHMPVVVCDQIPTCLNDFTGIYHYGCGIEGCDVALKLEPNKTTGLYEVADEIGPFIQWTVTDENADEYGWWSAAAYYVLEAENADEELVAAFWDDEDLYDGHLWCRWTILSDADCTENRIWVRSCWWCHTEQVWEEEDSAYGIEYYPVEVACNSEEDITLVCMHCNGAKGGDHKITIKGGVKGKDWADLSGYYCDNEEEIPAIHLIHNYEVTRPSIAAMSKAATCTEVGYKTWKCINEGCVDDGHQYFVIYEQELGHKWPTTWITVVEPDDEGNIQGIWERYCERGCGSKERVLGNEADDPNKIVDPATCEHNLVLEDEKLPTCEEKGWKYFVCDKCYAYDKEETVDPLGHDFEGADWTYTVEPDCTNGGEKVAKCNRCKNYVKVDVPANGHKFDKTVEAKEATCVEAGYEEYVECSVCGEPETAIVVKPIDPKAHKLGEAKVITAATCAHAGEEIAVCELCGKAVTTYPEKLAHKWGEYVVTVPATLTTKGVKVRTCELCGEEDEPVEFDYEATARAEYTVKDLAYKSPKATGKAVLNPETKALDEVYARVTFFLENGECMIQIVPVKADGTFTAGAMGNYVHISVIIVDTPDAYGATEAIAHAYGNEGIDL